MKRDSFVSRAARLSTCQRCDTAMLTGIDEGLPYRVDALPLTVMGELVARLNGRSTYGYYMGRAWYRDVDRIDHPPRPAVLATHRCGQLLADHVEIERVAQMSRVVALLAQGPSDEDVNTVAVVRLCDLIGGRVIAEYDHVRQPAPF